jgi:hypothetical protein
VGAEADEVPDATDDALEDRDASDITESPSLFCESIAEL